MTTALLEQGGRLPLLLLLVHPLILILVHLLVLLVLLLELEEGDAEGEQAEGKELKRDIQYRGEAGRAGGERDYGSSSSSPSVFVFN